MRFGKHNMNTNPNIANLPNAASQGVQSDRLVKNGQLPRVEIRPGVYRIRRADLETILGRKTAPS